MVASVTNLITDGDDEDAESLFDTLGDDVLDVLLAALENPLKAIGVVVSKVAGKARIQREGK